MANQVTRWDSWMGRAKTCFRAATVIDSSVTAVTATVRELEVDPNPDDVVEALRAAEAALQRAREAVEIALQARKLTPANREPTFGLAG